MKIAIFKERRPYETRVAATPETVKKLKGLGVEEIVIEAGAGTAAAYTDQAYGEAGATIVPDAAAAAQAADVIFKIQRPMAAAEGVDELSLLRQGHVLMSPLSALTDRELVQALAGKGVTAFALELIPRITRAQSMDILSSQANLAGYKSVLLAANHFGRIFPQMMTPAGTLAPSRAFIMGVGVAGLQAIATARRLGCVVTATDVRPATKEQVQSLGAKFVAVEDEEFKAAETAGGYAKEMSAEYRAKQAALVADHIKTQDIVITTALIPGRKAPVLVTEEMVSTMKPGSVIVDMAVEQGGNCPLSQYNVIVDVRGVKVIGPANLPGELATDSSALFARNLLNFITPLVDKETKALRIDTKDEVVKGTLVTQSGQIVHPALVQAAS
ncbi:MAG: Re/Si-specific NAD(P)(+) transhydrogenase subunit alpha [Alphaproteobacteria bacterium]|nr:Re/Si-specific NAD(P)(+) transhydrogenase subunit alpha [Alphaproteobacteria bacterium]MBV8413017.1 Re/Si-specific NAD(P)(+) transhydrogenase subunit alpha [Alphaproteobacteria bacterium]